jgi:hypothetical protein
VLLHEGAGRLGNSGDLINHTLMGKVKQNVSKVKIDEFYR